MLAAASRVSGEPLGLEVLTPAVAAGLVELAELRVRFGHPLMRSAIAQGGPEPQRRAAHAALAETFAEDPARAIWHRVAAAHGTDDALADELAAEAKNALRRGSMVTAAETLGRAAALTGDEPARGARLLDAAELALDIGRDDLVERLLADAGPLALAPADQPRRAWLQRISRRRAPEPAWFEAHLARIDELAEAGDAARASQALLTVAFRAWWSDVPQPLRERMVARARALPPGTPEVIVLVALALVAPEEHGPEVAGWLERIEPDELPSELLRVAAAITGVVGAFDRGVVIGDHAIERLRARGRYGMLAPALVGRAWDGRVRRRLERDAWPPRRRRRWSPARPSSRCGPSPALAAAGALTGLRGDARRRRWRSPTRPRRPCPAAPRTACAR